MSLKKQWNVYLIHHSHTDIGYTERQDKIINYHCDFIKQAIDILNDIHVNEKEEYKGFIWQCENYWQVKNFYAHASQSYIDDFEKYVRSGEIGLSGNYLNMTELISKDVLDTRLEQARVYGEKIGHFVTAGMAADINGFAWGYADALYNHGIRYLYSCLHPHHGMFPLYKKVMPFYWESTNGHKVLVWNGEHYHFGNEMFLAPHGGTSYMTYDEFLKRIINHDILKTSSEETEKTENKIATFRMECFLENLEEEGYPYELVSFMVSGAITDNAPPSAEIARRVNQLNDYYKGKIHFQMVTLEQFFTKVEEQCQDIPVYSGDWNDWWADGVGSTPVAVKVFCDARRKYNICKKLDMDGCLGNAELMDKAAEAFPFTAGEEEVRYIDKTGCIIRPGVDQLPGSNMEFYLLQNGIILEGTDKTVTIAVKDAPLVTFGELEAKPVHLCDGNNMEVNRGDIYSWVMNNFWETNFKVDLGGFYEFSYTISTHDKMKKEEAIKICEADNEGILGFYIK